MDRNRPLLPAWRGLPQTIARALARAARTAVVLLTATAWAQGLPGSPALGASPGTVVQTPQVRAELLAYAPDGVAPGATVWLGLQLAHQPNWHTYWKNPGDSGLPTQLRWTLPPGITAQDTAWPVPQKIRIGSLANYGYEGTVLLPVALHISPQFSPGAQAQTLDVRLDASWLVCQQECIPQDGSFALQLPLHGSTGLQAAAFAAARAQAPQPLAQGAQATLRAGALLLRVNGLPAAWRGHALDVFPEAGEVLDAPQSPEASDAVASSGAPERARQLWSGGVWSAHLALSDLRSSAPQQLAFVLRQGAQSVRVDARVEGVWPALPSAAALPPALQSALDSARSTQLAQSAPDTGLAAFFWALGAAFLGGALLNLMPCVFPVLAIKLLAFARTPGRHAQRALGLAYSAGVVLSFVGLGGLLLLLRAGGEQIGWGFQLQSAPTVAALALLFTLIGLNLMGLLQTGQVLPPGLAGLQLRHPLGDAFLSGVLAVAIASPCTAPLMGAALGYAIALPGARALALFAVLGLGLALPYLLASWIPGLARALPRPGAWMDTLRRLLAFPMWATVVWLLWILGHLRGVDGAMALLALLLALSLLAWALAQSGRSKRFLVPLAAALLLLLGYSMGPAVLQDDGAGAQRVSAPDARWQSWAPGRVEAELAAGKPVFVDFTAAWCITCQVNRRNALANADVLADFARAKVTLLEADWTRRDPAIALALTQLGRSGVPVYVLYRPGQAPRVLTEILSVAELRAAIAQTSAPAGSAPV